MTPDFFDNRSKILKDDLVAHVQAGDKMSVAASVFSMYAYRELREQLNNLDEFRFIYTSPAFLSERGKKEQREFYIPRLDRERGVGGTDLEIRLRNELTQKAIATECAQWIRDKATFKSFKGAAGLPPSLTVEMSPSADRTGADVASYIPFNGFTTVELGAARSADAYGVICRQDGTSSRMLLNTFEQAWSSGDLDDVTDAVVDNISQMYRMSSWTISLPTSFPRRARDFARARSGTCSTTSSVMPFWRSSINCKRTMAASWPIRSAWARRSPPSPW